MSTAPDALLLLSAAGRCLAASRSAARLLGRTDTELRQASVAELVVDAERLREGLRQVATCGATSVVARIALSSGQQRPVRWELVGLSSGRAGRRTLVAALLSPPREEATAAEHARLEGVLSALPIGVSIVEPDGRIRDANPAAAHLVGLAPHSVPGRLCREVFRLRDEAGRSICDWACPLNRSPRAPVGGTARALLGGEGTAVRAVYWNCALLPGPDAEPLGWVEVIREVSRLHEVDTLRQTLLSAVSHELLTPIAIIKGHAETLRDPQVRADAALAEAAALAIDEESERLRRLVINVLDAARASSGAFTVELAPLALGPLVERSLQRFRGRSRRHQFVAALPPGLPLVLGDRERLESVLYNLLDNAVKYAPRGGLVTVRAALRATEVEVVVQDQGVGIRHADLQRIFQPYFRADASTRPSAEGSGLGLYVCKTIVEAHGGRIWAESTPGRGTAIHFTLPRAEPARLPAVRR